MKHLLKRHENADLIFEDTVLAKKQAKKIELTRRQYSGSEHRVIRGIGLVTCIYVNPESSQFWAIDYRVYDPDSDGKTKLEHVSQMRRGLIEDKLVACRTVLMDSWYARQKMMQLIDTFGKIYSCPLKKNRLVDDTGGVEKYKAVEQLIWHESEIKQAKVIKVKGFPGDKTEFIATNDLAQDSTDAVQQVCVVRWKIEVRAIPPSHGGMLGAHLEEFHREIKQLTGIEACQCTKARIQRNHIACAMLVWLRLKQLASSTGHTVYALKHRLLESVSD